MSLNKAEREGKEHRAKGKPKSTGPHNKLFPSDSEKKNKVDFDNAYDAEDKRRSRMLLSPKRL